MAANISLKISQQILKYLESLPKDSVINFAELGRKFNTSYDAIKKRVDQVNKEKKLNLTGGGKGGSKIESSSLTDKEKNIFKKGFNKKTLSQMATEITGLPYDNKITKAKHAQLYRYNLTQSKLGKIDSKETVKGVRPKGTTPENIKGFGAYRKAQQDLMNLDPDLYKDLTPAQVDARLKKAINFSTVSGAIDRKAIPKSLYPSFEHFQGIVPGTIAKDPKAISKVGITTQDFNFNVLGAKAKNNIYKTIKNNLRTANAALKAGEVDEAKKSIKVVNEIYDDVASKLKTVDRKKLPKYNLKDNFIDEINLKEVNIDSKQNLDKSLTEYIKFVASGPTQDVKKITQPNLKKAVKLSLKGDEEGLKDLVKSRVPGVKSGEKFVVPTVATLGATKLLTSESEAAESETPIKYSDEAGAFIDPKTEEPVSNKTMLEWAADNPMPTAAIASAPLLSKTVRQGTGKLLKGLLSTLASPLAATGFAGATIKENLDEGKNIVDATVDPMVGIELLYPEAAKRIGAKGVTGALGKALSLGRVGAMLTPVGAGITALGLGKMGYNALQAEKEKLAGMSDEEREAYLAQAQEQMDLSA